MPPAPYATHQHVVGKVLTGNGITRTGIGASSLIGGDELVAGESSGGPCQPLRYRSTVAQVQVATPVPKKS